MRFNTQKYRQLELFIKTEPGETGRLYMVSGSARKMFQSIQKVAENYGESGDDL